MMTHQTRWLRDGTFAATTDGGRTVFIHRETEVNDDPGTGPLGPPLATRLVTSTGGAVDWVEKGGYVVRSTGMILVSDDPDAP